MPSVLLVVTLVATAGGETKGRSLDAIEAARVARSPEVSAVPEKSLP